MPLRDITAEQVIKANKGFEPLPDGIYTVEVMEAKEDTSATGKDFLALTLRVADDEEYTGRRVWARLYFNDESMRFTAPALLALTNGAFNNQDYGRAEDFLDLTCRVILKTRIDNTGTARNDVATWLPLAEDIESDTTSAKASIAAGKSGRARGL